MIDSVLYDELRRAAKASPEFHAFEIPDVEARLWGGEIPHPLWREIDLPVRLPSGRNYSSCEQCGKALEYRPVVVWKAPHEHLKTMWVYHAIHVTCPEAS